MAELPVATRPDSAPEAASMPDAPPDPAEDDSPVDSAALDDSSFLETDLPEDGSSAALGADSGVESGSADQPMQHEPGPSADESPEDPDAFNIAVEELKALGVFKGEVFMKADLKDILSEHGRKGNFTIRSETKSFVCSRQGASSWCSVADTDKLVEKMMKKILKTEGTADESQLRQEILDNNMYKKPRKQTSDRCGCRWQINFSKIKSSPGMVKVTKVFPIHTNGCDPSPPQFRKQEKRRGRVYSKALILTGIDYLQAGAPYRMYRSLLQKENLLNTNSHMTSADAQTITNFKRRCLYYQQRQNSIPADGVDAGDLDNSPSTANLQEFWNDILSEQFQDEGLAVLMTLNKLKKSIPGFEFRVAQDPTTAKLTAIFWIFPEQRRDLQMWSRVFFVDGTHGTNGFNWPLFTPCVMNSDNHIRPVVSLALFLFEP